MSTIRSLLSAGVFGLAVVVAQSSLAQPPGGKPGPAPGAPGAANAPAKPNAAAAAKPAAAKPAGKAPGAESADKKPAEARGEGNKGKPGERGEGKRGKKGKRDKKDDKDKNKGPSKRELLQTKKDSGKPLTAEEKEELGRLWERRLQLANKRRGPHQTVFLELLEKQKEGKLTDEDRAKLAKLDTIRKRHRGLQKRLTRRDKTRQRRLRRAKRSLMKKFPGVQKDAQAKAELKKHAQREAMLERAIDVARAEGLVELVKRAEQLAAKEQTRHTEWMKKHFSKAKQGEKK